jgi:hypothetical protein
MKFRYAIGDYVKETNERNGLFCSVREREIRDGKPWYKIEYGESFLTCLDDLEQFKWVQESELELRR